VALAAPGEAASALAGAPASMKYGAMRVSPRAAAIAWTSREYHWFAAGSLWRRKPPWGSVMRSNPVTVDVALDICTAVAEAGGDVASGRSAEAADVWAECVAVDDAGGGVVTGSIPEAGDD
jgi:hypothetical protein